MVLLFVTIFLLVMVAVQASDERDSGPVVIRIKTHLRFAGFDIQTGDAPMKELNDGNGMPILALGTSGASKDIAKTRQAINWAIEAGYRHIDTAAAYNNEDEVGLGIKDVISRGLVKREDLYVTTKLFHDSHQRDQVVPALKSSLSRLGLQYVDLYLIDSPDSSNPADGDILETWQGMEEAKQLGITRSIGVSNFNETKLEKLIKSCMFIKPAVNQIEVHPARTRESLVSVCEKLNIAVMAYSPFGYMVNRDTPNRRPPRINDPTLTKMAQKYRKNTTQIVLRYLIDRNLIPIPRSTNKDHIKQNIDVFDFKLTPDEVATINKFNRNESILQW